MRVGDLQQLRCRRDGRVWDHAHLLWREALVTEREPAAWGFGLEEELGLSDAVIDQVPIFLPDAVELGRALNEDPV